MKSKPFNLDTPALPMNYAGFMFRRLCEDGYQAEALLDGTELTAALFSDPHFRMQFSDLERFFTNAIQHTGDPYIGPRVAQHFHPNFMGLPAYAAINAPTLRDALDVMNRFFFLTCPAIEFQFPDLEADLPTNQVAIRLRPNFLLKGVAYFVMGGALIVCNNLLRAILNQDQVASSVEIAAAEPAGWANVADAFSRVPVRFDAQENRLIFSAELLDAPLPGADPVNHFHLIAMCEKYAVDTDYETTPVSRVRSFLESSDNLGAPLSEAASALGYSERGLRRDLERSGASYRGLSDEIRERRARFLLSNTERAIQSIACELGYDSASNFSRSFKRWTGVTPKQFRELRLKRSDGEK